MTRNTPLLVIVLVLSVIFLGCPKNGNSQPPGNLTIKDVIQTTTTTNIPAAGDYYVTVAAEPDGDAHIPDAKCADRSLWSFARQFIGITSSAGAALTATITPSSEPAQTITIPIFVTSAAEVDANHKGSNCETKFWSRPITFTFNSNMNPSFDINLKFLFKNQVDVSALKNILTESASLMTALAGASSTPASLAASLTSEHILNMATKVDAAMSNTLSSNSSLEIMKQLNTVSGDKITFRMPKITTSHSGVKLNEWDVGGAIYLTYSREKFKTGKKWNAPEAIMRLPICPSTTPGAQTDLQRILINGDATGGFTLRDITAASDPASLSERCNQLKQFLARILIPDDALAARFAVLKMSNYEKMPELRADSGCFDDTELVTLRKMETTTGAPFTFSEKGGKEPGRNNDTVTTIMAPITTTLLSGNASLIKNRHITKPVNNFSLVLGAGDENYLTGDDAVVRLAQERIWLVCYQARPNFDLSSIASIAVRGEIRTGAIVSFDENKKITSLVLMPSQDVARGIGIEKANWLDSKKSPNCVVND